MKLHRSLPVFLCAAVTTAVAAPNPVVDPSTLQDKVTVAVGKTIAVQFELKGNELTRPKTVEKVANKPPTLSLDFRKQGDMLILTTKNPFTKELKFRALARLKDRKAYFETSIVPVKAGLLSLELWQDPIEELILFDFTLVDDQP
ncbi:hypothetical protein [Singulisphaera sp. GP187]|uniref:hypothetical protein n=1 Tax=Singulisphaera sp. GP187 TaxID=1882752 RepID=UPI0009408093|nr:hypothetical protein [Singulisphaera sp. GP187]